MARKPTGPLRRGWTTGACATAATKAAGIALFSGSFPETVTIELPKGRCPEFEIIPQTRTADQATAGVIKDAGDDPDVTHGALICATVERGPSGSGIRFEAGLGVGTVTKPGLPIPPGEPAINPVPRQLMLAALTEVAARYQEPPDLCITVSVPNGAELAKQTWNPRLGIVGGLSILGTTGVVVPYSCSAWIHSIHSGINIARANGFPHVAGCTGSVSEKAVQARYQLPDEAMLDMGDFVGGMLKYLRKHPVPQLTIGGGFGKLCKLAQGHLDLHSGRSQVDFDWLAQQWHATGAPLEKPAAVTGANTANEVLTLAEAAGVPLADYIARQARQQAYQVLRHEQIRVEVLIVDRAGRLVGQSGFPEDE